jgi:hypothetical protein
MAHALSRRRVVSPYRRVFSFLNKAYIALARDIEGAINTSA